MVAIRLATVVLCLVVSGCASTGVPSPGAAPGAAPAATAPAMNRAGAPTLVQVREQVQASSPNAAATLDAYLSSAGPGKDRRTALELGTFYHLSAEGRGRDLAAARRLLAELLATEPKPPRQAEFAVIAGLVDELVRLEAETAAGSQRIAGLVDEMVRLEADTAARSQRTRGELASMRRQIEQLQQNVKARDQLLKKVADAVVRGRPKS